MAPWQCGGDRDWEGDKVQLEMRRFPVDFPEIKKQIFRNSG
jgi:hypothetical protein